MTLAPRRLFRVLVPFTAFLVVSTFAPIPAAAEEFEKDKMLDLLERGRVEFGAAGDTRLDRNERNKHLRAAHDLLMEAFLMIDTWCESHPEDIEELEDYCCEIARMRYFIRKEAPNGVLEDEAPPKRVGPPPDWPPEPPPDLHEPAGAKPVAPPPVPEEDREVRKKYKDAVKQHLEYARDYERKHPYDEVGLRDIYLDILENAPPGSEAYLLAMKKFSELNGKLKECYRKVRDRDMDELKRSGSEVRKLVFKISRDLRSKFADIRLRAAQYLGKIGSGEAAHHLAPMLFREKDAKVRDEVVTSLTEIGGAKVTRELAKLKTKRNEIALRAAVRVLGDLAARSPIDRRLASTTLGVYVGCMSKEVRYEALDALLAMGPDGVWGLMKAAEVKDYAIRLRVLQALGETGDGRAGDILGGFLVFAAKGKLRPQREAAVEALKKIGKPCVPYIGRFLGNPRMRQWTALVLRDITGVSFKSAEQVKAWWARNG